MMDNQNTMNDTIHPNEHGYGALAQELYMRIALSKNLKQRVMQLHQTNLSVPDLQDFMAQEIRDEPKKRAQIIPIS